PLNMECRVTEILDYDPNDGIIGEVVASYADQDVLLDGKMDLRKVQPMIWAIGGDFNYYSIGNRIET
ncbi:MAG: flavin reductase family protein, partial [Candidatus Thorarchaeota archaeon]